MIIEFEMKNQLISFFFINFGSFMSFRRFTPMLNINGMHQADAWQISPEHKLSAKIGPFLVRFAGGAGFFLLVRSSIMSRKYIMIEFGTLQVIF